MRSDSVRRLMGALYFGGDGASVEPDRRHAAGSRVMFSGREPAALGQAFHFFHPRGSPPVACPVLTHETAFPCSIGRLGSFAAVVPFILSPSPRFAVLS
jgi:hypothetical protein